MARKKTESKYKILPSSSSSSTTTTTTTTIGIHDYESEILKGEL